MMVNAEVNKSVSAFHSCMLAWSCYRYNANSMTERRYTVRVESVSVYRQTHQPLPYRRSEGCCCCCRRRISTATIVSASEMLNAAPSSATPLHCTTHQLACTARSQSVAASNRPHSFIFCLPLFVSHYSLPVARRRRGHLDANSVV